MFEAISAFYSSPAWVRMLLDAIIFVPLFLMSRNYRIPAGNVLLAIPIILFVRDLAGYFLNYPIVYFLSDGAILCLYFWWMNAYNTRFARAKSTTIVFGSATLILSVLAAIFPNLTILRFSIDAIALIVAIWLAIAISNIAEANTKEAAFIEETRATFLVILISSRTLLLFQLDPTVPVAQWVLYPLSLSPHFYLIIRYLQFFSKQADLRDKYNTAYINSLFDFMRTIGNAMTERIEVKNVLNYVTKSITNYLVADAGVVMLRDTTEGVLRVSAMEGYFPPPFAVPPIVKTKLTGVQKFFENTPIKMGETVLGECAANNQAIFIRQTSEDKRMEANTKDDSVLISSIMLAPLIVNKEVFGVVAVMRRKKDNLFTDADFERARIFIEYASLTLDSLYNYAQLLEKQEIEREVSIAATIQKKLLPSRTPRMIASMVNAWSKPAKGVSGDYYDIIPLNAAGKFALVICDVAGKGVPASLIMVMIRTIIHTIGGAKKSASEVVSWINRGIAGRVDIERFATLSYMTYDPITRDMEYSNAGHHPVLVYRAATATLEKIDSPGLPVGLERDSEYQLVRFHLNVDDVILAYTDGILEAMNYRSEQFEEERLTEAVLEKVNTTPKEIVDHIRKRVDEFVGQAKQHDDMTLIVLKAQ